MAVQTLPQGRFLYLPFIVPQTKIIRMDIEAEDNVDVIVLLNDYELEQYRLGLWTPPINRMAAGIKFFNAEQRINLSSLGIPLQRPTSLGQIATNPFLTSLLGGTLPVGSTWYLIIVNRSTRDIAVFYRVYNA